MEDTHTNSFQKTNDVVLSYLAQKSFRLSALEKEIQRKELPMRVAPGYTVRTYLSELVDEGFLAWNPLTQAYRQANQYEPNSISHLPPLPN